MKYTFDEFVKNAQLANSRKTAADWERDDDAVIDAGRKMLKEMDAKDREILYHTFG